MPKPTQIKTLSLYDKTIELLKHRPAIFTLAHIAKSSGLNEDWLRKLSSGAIKEPSVNKVQKLYEFLSNTKLKV